MAAFDAGISAAMRRRERRLRSWWRHERMSIAAVLATMSCHSYPKVDTKKATRRHRVRAGPGSRCSCAAAGGTAGGSADDPDSFVSPGAAER